MAEKLRFGNGQFLQKPRFWGRFRTL